MTEKHTIQATEHNPALQASATMFKITLIVVIVLLALAWLG